MSERRTYRPPPEPGAPPELERVEIDGAPTPEPLPDDKTAPYPVPAATVEALAAAQPVISWWLRLRRRLRLSWWER